MNVYSFKDVNGAFDSPVTGPFPFSGQLGIGSFVVKMTRERTALDAAADGNIMGSSMAGNDGTLDIDLQQTSALHQFLVDWLNALLAAQATGDVSNWFGATISLQSLTTQTRHVLTGVAPGKQADTPYRMQGEHVIWTLHAADIANG